MKLRLQWDYVRRQWRLNRGLNAFGKRIPSLLWLRTCPRCSRQELMNQSRPMCSVCNQQRREALSKISGKALRAVHAAILRGELPRLDGSIKCVDCGNRAQVYDHRDYGQPLDVDPVCRYCNCRRGPAVDMRPHLIRMPLHLRPANAQTLRKTLRSRCEGEASC